MPQSHLSFEFGAHYICNTIPLNEDFIIQVCLDDAFALIRNFHLNYLFMYCCKYYQTIFICRALIFQKIYDKSLVFIRNI